MTDSVHTGILNSVIPSPVYKIPNPEPHPLLAIADYYNAPNTTQLIEMCPESVCLNDFFLNY